MRKRKQLIIGIFIILIFLSLVGGYFVWKGKRVFQVPPLPPPAEKVEKEETLIKPYTKKETRPEAIIRLEKPKEEVKVYFPERCEIPKELPKGKIYLSLKPITGGRTGLYYFDVEKKRLEKFLVDEYNNWSVNFSKDGEKIVFLSDRSGYPQIFVADKDGKNIKQVTNTEYEGLRRFHPVFSPDGKKIVFLLWPNVFDLLAESLQIHFTDLEGKEEFFDRGATFLFLSDSKTGLIMKNVGLFLVDLEKKELDKVIELRDEKNELILGDVLMGKINISRDEKFLSFSNFFKRKEFYVFEIVSTRPFTVKLKAIMNKIGFWSAFSPDGNYLAIQEAEEFDKEGLPVKPKLVIYDTCQFKKVLEFDLSDYSGEVMWLTDWR